MVTGSSDRDAGPEDDGWYSRSKKPETLILFTREFSTGVASGFCATSQTPGDDPLVFVVSDRLVGGPLTAVVTVAS